MDGGGACNHADIMERGCVTVVWVRLVDIVGLWEAMKRNESEDVTCALYAGTQT